MFWVRVGLVVFVLAWLFDPFGMRWIVPLWLPFLVAVGLELSYFLGAWRGLPPAGRDRGPQPVDLERYGFPDDPEEERPPFYVPPPRRPLRRLLVGAALIALLAGVAWLSAGRGWNGIDPDDREAGTARFSQVASGVVGRPVEVRCDEKGEFVGAVQHADGVAVVGGRVAYLTPDICFSLYEVAFRDEISFSRTARAIAVLAHEAWHLRGERNEGRTECFALQSGVDVGRRLGLRESTARQMMRQQLAENALRESGALEYRVPPECRNGGRLDLHPDADAFP